MNCMTKKLVGLVFAGLLVLPLLSSAAFAAAPEWSAGFPKLSQKNALLQWAPVKGASEYKVYRGESKAALKVIATVKVNRYIDKDLPAGKTYSYAVSAVSGGKEGERSSVGSVSTAAEKVFVPLKAPKLVGSHIKEQAGGKPTIGLRWEGAAGTDLVGINVYRSKSKGKDYALVGSSQSDTFEDKDVQSGSSYYYVVTAVDNQFNETKYSNELEVALAAPEKEVAKEAKKAETTTMRPTKLLFRIPRQGEQSSRRRSEDEPVPGNAQDVAVDEAVGHIYVTTFGYGGILVYDMEGKLQFGIRKDGVGGDVKINVAENVVVGDRGNVFLTDFNSPEISVFDFTGRPVDTIKVDISDFAPGKRARNYGIALDASGNMFVSEPVSNTIQILDPKGRRRSMITSGKGSADDKQKPLFNGPSSVILTRDGDIVFVDSGFSRLLVYGQDGRFKRSIGKPGVNAGELYYPIGLALGSKGEIIVGSGSSPNVQAFSPDGKFLYALCNEKGDGPLPVSDTRGICVDGANRLYVSEGLSNRVSVFQMEDRTIEVVPQK